MYIKQLLILSLLISTAITYAQEISIPQKNKDVINKVIQFGLTIASTYEKEVCTELVI